MQNYFKTTVAYSNPLDTAFTYYVIDTSIAGNDDIVKNISDLCVKGKRIYITTTTVDELIKLVDNRDCDTAATARKLLKLSSITYKDSFEVIDTSEYTGINSHINQELGICDSRILQFCYENRDAVMLLTADRAMSLYARSLQINVMCLETRVSFIKVKNVYLPDRPQNFSFESNPDYPALHIARQNVAMVINHPQNFEAGIGIRVITSDNQELENGPIKLSMGDTIMIARIDPKNDIHFSVYKVVSLEEPRGKYELIYSKLYHSYYTYFNVGGNSQYERFLMQFKRRYTKRI